jgi:arylamine N-acetyltransferase
MTTEVTAVVDVAAYFDRIGYRGPAEPTVETVQTLVAAHNRSIPFENLDPLLGIPVADLGAAALAHKLVSRRRGGYCYEHNGLMGYVLEELGFGVERLAGRVVRMHPDGPLPAETHQVLSVTVPGVDGPLLVDVGFGGQTLTSPIRLEAGRCRKPATSRTASAAEMTATSWRPRSAATGSRCTSSPLAPGRASISKSEVGMCLHIPTLTSSPA